MCTLCNLCVYSLCDSCAFSLCNSCALSLCNSCALSLCNSCVSLKFLYFSTGCSCFLPLPPSKLPVVWMSSLSLLCHLDFLWNVCSWFSWLLCFSWSGQFVICPQMTYIALPAQLMIGMWNWVFPGLVSPLTLNHPRPDVSLGAPPGLFLQSESYAVVNLSLSSFDLYSPSCS